MKRRYIVTVKRRGQVMGQPNVTIGKRRVVVMADSPEEAKRHACNRVLGTKGTQSVQATHVEVK